MPMPFSLKLVGIDETQRKFYIKGLDRFITLDYNEETLKIRVLNEDNKEIASFELQNEDEDSYLLYAMGDLPSEFQRKGIGTAAIQMFKTYFQEIGMPTTLKEVGVKKTDLPSIANLYTFNGKRTIDDIFILNYETCLEILNACYE